MKSKPFYATRRRRPAANAITYSNDPAASCRCSAPYIHGTMYIVQRACKCTYSTESGCARYGNALRPFAYHAICAQCGAIAKYAEVLRKSAKTYIVLIFFRDFQNPYFGGNSRNFRNWGYFPYQLRKFRTSWQLWPSIPHFRE